MNTDFLKKLKEHYAEHGFGRNSFTSNAQNAQNAENACVRCKDLKVINIHKGADTYIGSKYGQPYNIVVVCLDPGKEPKNFEERRAQIEGQNINKLNLHMKGTLATLKALLRPIGIMDQDLFSHFAMVNACKCFPADGTMKKAPKQFFVNCREHIWGELEILEPDVIITQGSEAIDAIANFMKKVEGEKETFFKPLIEDLQVELPEYFTHDYLDHLVDKYFRLLEIKDKQLAALCPPHPSDQGGRWHLFAASYLGMATEILRRTLSIGR